MNEDRYTDLHAFRFFFGKNPFIPNEYSMSFRGIGRAIRAKDTTADYLKLDIRQVTATGFFRTPRARLVIEQDWQTDRELMIIDGLELWEDDPEYYLSGALSLRFVATKTEEWQEIGLIARAQTFGGRRFYFECPDCNNATEILYRFPLRGLYACRNCHKLTYTSVQDCHKAPGAWSIQARDLREHPTFSAWLEQDSNARKAFERKAKRLKGLRIEATPDPETE